MKKKETPWSIPIKCNLDNVTPEEIVDIVKRLMEATHTPGWGPGKSLVMEVDADTRAALCWATDGGMYAIICAAGEIDEYVS